MLLIKYESRHSNQPISLLYPWIFIEFFNHKTTFLLSMLLMPGQYDLAKELWEREQHSECSHFTIFSFMKQIFCLQKIITYVWIGWRKRNHFSYRNFRLIFMTKDYGNKNLRIFVLFLYSNASCAAPVDRRL